MLTSKNLFLESPTQTSTCFSLKLIAWDLSLAPALLSWAVLILDERATQLEGGRGPIFVACVIILSYTFLRVLGYLNSNIHIHPPKINIEPENDGLEDDFPLPGVYIFSGSSC